MRRKEGMRWAELFLCCVACWLLAQILSGVGQVMGRTLGAAAWRGTVPQSQHAPLICCCAQIRDSFGLRLIRLCPRSEHLLGWVLGQGQGVLWWPRMRWQCGRLLVIAMTWMDHQLPRTADAW
jgi:hypothetical protein